MAATSRGGWPLRLAVPSSAGVRLVRLEKSPLAQNRRRSFRRNKVYIKRVGIYNVRYKKKKRDAAGDCGTTPGGRRIFFFARDHHPRLFPFRPVSRARERGTLFGRSTVKSPVIITILCCTRMTTTTTLGDFAGRITRARYDKRKTRDKIKKQSK